MAFASISRYCKRLLFPSRSFCNHRNSFPEENPSFQQEWNRERKGPSTLETNRDKNSPPYIHDTKWFGGSLNRVILIGYVGQNPVARNISSSTVAWNFPLSTAYKRKTGEEGEQVVTDWHNVTVYASPSAKFLEVMIQKGNQLFLSGSLHTNTFVDHSGIKRKRCEISVSMEGKGERKIISKSCLFTFALISYYIHLHHHHHMHI
ncbi:Single-stranded DNA-binding protein [Galdieria sulphuraria]|nr:Single-stranded DNA-binding protein [Galdieria sulphuraria]